jgi:hypothetical protein
MHVTRTRPTELALSNALKVHEAERPKAVVHGYNDSVGEVGHEVSLVQTDVRASLVVAAAVDEEHHGQAVGVGRREDVEEEAVLAGDRRTNRDEDAWG